MSATSVGTDLTAELQRLQGEIDATQTVNDAQSDAIEDLTDRVAVLEGGEIIDPEPPDPPVPDTRIVLFASAWDKRTGNTPVACADGALWQVANCASPAADRVSVVPVPTFTPPPMGMRNCLAIRYEASTDIWCGVFKKDGWELVPVGGSFCRRMYVLMDIDGTGGGAHHPVQAAYQSGSCPYEQEYMIARGDPYNFAFAYLQNGSSPEVDNHQWWSKGVLRRGVWYMREELLTREANTRWRCNLRITDMNGIIIAEDKDFVDDRGFNGKTLAQFNAENRTISTPDPSCLRHMMIVNQGVGASRGSDNAEHNRIYYGGVCVTSGDWAGLYVPGEGVPARRRRSQTHQQRHEHIPAPPAPPTG